LITDDRQVKKNCSSNGGQPGKAPACRRPPEIGESTPPALARARDPDLSRHVPSLPRASPASPGGCGARAAAVNTWRCWYRVAVASCPPILPTKGIPLDIDATAMHACTHRRIWSIDTWRREKFAFSGEQEKARGERKLGNKRQLDRVRTLPFCNY